MLAGESNNTNLVVDTRRGRERDYERNAAGLGSTVLDAEQPSNVTNHECIEMLCPLRGCEFSDLDDLAIAVALALTHVNPRDSRPRLTVRHAFVIPTSFFFSHL